MTQTRKHYEDLFFSLVLPKKVCEYCRKRHWPGQRRGDVVGPAVADAETMRTAPAPVRYRMRRLWPAMP
jgi:hypothetical protein